MQTENRFRNGASLRPQNKWQSCAYSAWEKMNRLALQNPPRQAEKRQYPAFLPEEQWPDEMQNVLFIRRYGKRLFFRFHENGSTMRLSRRGPYCH